MGVCVCVVWRDAARYEPDSTLEVCFNPLALVKAVQPVTVVQRMRTGRCRITVPPSDRIRKEKENGEKERHRKCCSGQLSVCE